MHITREKRPDRVICKWKSYEIEIDEENILNIKNYKEDFYPIVSFPKSEIPNLIKALLEIQKETK